MKSRIIILFTLFVLIAGADAQRWPFRYRTPTPSPIPVRTPAPVPTPPPTPKPTPRMLVALPNYDVETSTRLQIFLDNNDFGPGKIDGQMGEFFRKALISYKHSHLVRETGFID